MPDKKRVLILTCDSGFGHRSAANSIAKALNDKYPQEVVTWVVNPIYEDSAPLFLQETERNYDHTVKANSNWYRFSYEISDSRPASAVVDMGLTLVLYRNMKRIIGDFHPDAIINTSNLFNAPTGAVLIARKQKIPFYTVVTDLADVHSSWFNSSPDQYYVASEMVKSKAIASGISAQKIFISGIPVDPDFSRIPANPSDLRGSFGLDPALTTILIVGSRRVSGLIAHLEALEKVPQPFQVVVIAGGDQELYAEASRREWSFPVQVKNFVHNMPEWMACADLLITKAGGLILSEGLAAGLPILLVDYLPGQEEGNVRYILDHQAGAIVGDPAELSGLVDEWLRNDCALLKIIAANASHLGHPDAALTIAGALWQAAERNQAHPVP